MRCLTEEEALPCEGELTIDECENVVKQLKNNKAPGSDGLTAEFYKAFWYDVKDLLITSINEGFVKKELSFTQKRGIITLLYKKGDKTNLNNWRPISLLNYDYKICTAVLAVRLQKVIGKLINTEQTGYVKGRFIGQNIRLIEDVIDYCTQNNQNGAILFVDFKKAFDTLEIPFLENCL